ncbi:MAG TPA: hypothetical protein VKE88_02515, partial [Candidatus Nanoarchaeia archaeon]|nr:hypothetical protein [Candidatus Nanoarchaeia archaeon]
MRQSAKTNTIVVFSIAAIVIIGLVFYLTQRQPKAIIVPGECVELPEVDRDSCFLVLAGNNNDTSYCNSVSREDMRASCFNQSWITDSCRYSELIGTESCEVNAAIEAKNILLCESISNYGS